MMRKFFHCTFIFATLFFFPVACTTDAGEYYVSFAADGNPVTLTWGDIPYLLDEYDFAYGGIDGVKTLLHVEASMENSSNHYLRFYFHGTTTGTYSGADIDADYSTDYANNVRYGNQNFTVTVSRLEEANGIIEGTFSGSLINSDLDVLAITDGSFRVIRVE